MSLYTKPLADITEADLLDLITYEMPEGRTLDYKRDLPGGSGTNKSEFLADISSFANTAGGHVIYGIEESKGVAAGVLGVGSEDADADILRLANIAEAGLAPRLPGLAFQAVPLARGGHAIIAAVPQSPAAPHMVIFEGQQRFYARNSRGKYPMSVDELRASFTSAGILAAVRLELEETIAALLRRTGFAPNDAWIDSMWGESLHQFPEGERAALRAAFTQVVQDLPIPRHKHMSRIVESVRLPRRPEGVVELDRQGANELVWFVLGGSPQARELRVEALHQASILGSLLAYDPAAQGFQHTATSQAIADLLREVEGYESCCRWVDGFRSQLLAELSVSARLSGPTFVLDMMRAVPLWALYHCQVNLYQRATSLYAFLTGKRDDPAPNPDHLLPNTPFGEEMQRQIEREHATAADVRRWNQAGDLSRFGMPPGSSASVAGPAV